MKSQVASHGCKLIGSRRSPYVRKVLILAEEVGLAARLELVPVVVNFRNLDPEPLNPHPLNQIPALVVGGGTVIYDSLVICDWLAEQAGAGAMFDGPGGRFEVLGRHALAQSLTDISMKLYGERKRRIGAEAETEYARAYRNKIGWGLKALEADAGGWMEGAFDIGQIGLAAFLSYLDLRFDELGWRQDCQALAAWFQRIGQRPSMQATEYQP